MATVREIYEHHLATSPDIRGHLAFLRDLASSCDHVTEFGVRWGSSTSAFIDSGAAFRGYDIEPTYQANALFHAAATEGKDAKYIIMSSLDAHDMEETDLLLIDSLHTYAHAKAELDMHHRRVRRYIVFHDTETFGQRGEDGGPGLWPAVEEFMADHPEWTIRNRFYHDNGLTVLERAVR
jgi:cephalosporin hydroxylase